MTRLRSFMLFCLCLFGLLMRLGYAQFVVSPGVRVTPYNPAPSSTDLSRWSAQISGGTFTKTAGRPALDGSPTVQFDIRDATSNINIEHQLAGTFDLRFYDSMTFWVVGMPSSVRTIGDLVTLVDVNNNRRWYALNILPELGWQQLTVMLNHPVMNANGLIGDPSFDMTRVNRIRFAQASVPAGTSLSLSAVKFEVNALNHAEATSGWIIDIADPNPPAPGNRITLNTSDFIGGRASIQASLYACADTSPCQAKGQADIAVTQALTGQTWDLSRKRYFSFYYKDVSVAPRSPLLKHYFLLYDTNNCYRQWLFGTPQDPVAVGVWHHVVVDLTDTPYTTLCPSPPHSFDPSNARYFEVGVFDGVRDLSAPYVFLVDEVAAYDDNTSVTYQDAESSGTQGT